MADKLIPVKVHPNKRTVKNDAPSFREACNAYEALANPTQKETEAHVKRLSAMLRRVAEIYRSESL